MSIYGFFNGFHRIDGRDIKADFSLDANAIKDKCTDLISAAQKAYDSISSLSDASRTFENTAETIALVEGYLSTFSSSLTFPKYVSTNKEVRDASVEANKNIDDFLVEVSMREDLYAAVKAIPNMELRDAADKRLVTHMLRRFRRSGLNLSEKSDRDLLKEWRKRISALSIEFSATIGEDKTFLTFTRAQLDGLSENQLSAFEKLGELFVVTMKYPDYLAVLKYCRAEDTRKAMNLAYASRCIENGERLVETLKLRHKCATLLKYPDHASFQLEEKMAKSPTEVMSFLEKVSKRLTPLIEHERSLLLKEKEAERGPSPNLTLEAHDFAYYNRIQAEKIGINEEEISRHFPLSKVLLKMLEIYERVLCLRFKEVPAGCLSWHPDALDGKTNNVMGYFFIDLFPRESKYSHAACFPLQPGMVDPCDEEDSTPRYQVPVAAMVTNFTKPDAGGESFLKHQEVVTLFHELGHAMHHICSKSRYSRFHGFAVEGDFVEAPSQMLENWCWNSQSLSFLTADSLLESSLKALLASKNLNTGFHYRRQIFFALFDISLHAIFPEGISPDEWTYPLLVKHWKDIRFALTGIREDPDSFGGNTFGHLMDDAGYYGYLWSLVISEDLFATKFGHTGAIFDGEVGLSYRTEILEPGSNKDAAEMVESFLGRPFNEAAFCKSLGIPLDN